ncbi:MAG: lysylphosphatidylglycerol synthase transmembrane domain-containing protein [Planctomycetaceae bacterium]
MTDQVDVPPGDGEAAPIDTTTVPTKRGTGRWWLSLILGVGVSIVCLYVALRGVPMKDVGNAFRKADYRTLPLMWGLLGCFYLMKAFRWSLILRPMGQYVTRQTFAPIMIGFAFNNVLPAHLGEFVRVFVFSKNEKLRATSVLSTVVLERIFDVLAILVFFFVGLTAVGGGMTKPSTPRQTTTVAIDTTNVKTTNADDATTEMQRPANEVDVNAYVRKTAMTTAVLAGFLVLGAAAYLVWTDPFVRIVESILLRIPFIPEGVRRKVCHIMEAGAEGLSALRHGVLLFHISWNSLVQWGINGVMMYVALRAFDIDVSFLAACLLLGAVAFGVTIPSSPGYFGVINIIFAAVINETTFGVSDKAGVLAASFYYHMGMYIPVTLLGLWYFSRTGLSLSDVNKEQPSTPSEFTSPGL